MSFYTSIRNTATTLLTKYGQAYTFTTYAQGAYDPTTGTNSVTSSTYSKIGVKSSYNTFERNNTAIQAGDIRFVAEDGDYEIGDTVVINSEDWRVMDVRPVEPADAGVIYILQLRK